MSEARDVIMLTLGTGVGGGIISGGQVMHGYLGMAGEIGHVPISDSDALCSCGSRGCLESFSSGAAIESRAREWAERRPERVERMMELSGGPEITAKGLMLAAGEGDQPATEILKETARWLARGILTVIRILNPEVIVLGGGVAQSGELLLKTLRGSLDEFASPTITYSTEIVTAALETYSALYGAAAMGMDVR